MLCTKVHELEQPLVCGRLQEENCKLNGLDFTHVTQSERTEHVHAASVRH